MLISLFQAIESVGGHTTESVTHGQCDARPTVTFPATEPHRPMAGTNTAWTEAHCVEQLGQDSNLPLDCKSDALTTTPPSPHKLGIGILEIVWFVDWKVKGQGNGQWVHFSHNDYYAYVDWQQQYGVGLNSWVPSTLSLNKNRTP